MENSKPVRLSRKVVYQSSWVNLYLDKVRFPNGFIVEKFHLLDFPRAAVAVVVENDNHDVIFARIPRYTTGTSEWELPAGGVEIGETILDAAKREALEETGYATANHKLIYSYYPMNGNANKQFHIVHCQALERIADFDPNEVSATRWFTQTELRRRIRDRVITDGFTLTALLLWLKD